jgi:DNA-directed RNA polymerase II subunit RPB2
MATSSQESMSTLESENSGTNGTPIVTNNIYQQGNKTGTPIAMNNIYQQGNKTPIYNPNATSQPQKSKLGSDKELHKANENTILARKVLQNYFETFQYPFTRHHIESFDQFLKQDLPAIFQSQNPLLILKERFGNTKDYKYRTEIFVGGESGTEIEIGTPTLQLQQSKEMRILFPNEARLRNLSYYSTVYVNVVIKITIKQTKDEEVEPQVLRFERVPFFDIPICLHSQFCVLHGKPASFLKEAGECPQDQGGYFIIDGSEKVLVTRQEQAFNTLYVSPQPRDPQVETYANISCLSPITREVKMVGMYWMRKTETLHITLPYILKPIPIFVLFRALGVQSDQDILRLIYPNLNSYEAKQMIPLLLPSIVEAHPFVDTLSALQFLKAMTKGFSVEHVYDVLFHKLFIHLDSSSEQENKLGSRVHFLAECVRKFMRVHTGIDPKTDKDDTRNQRCQTTGFLIRMLFQTIYNTWKKVSQGFISETFEYNKSIYSNESFKNLFIPKQVTQLFRSPEFQGNAFSVSSEIMRGFKGSWKMGGGEEAEGALQPLARQSYLDFMSHCRRVHLNFDTGMKLTGPRQLHTSQYGFYCTNETPGGASIGITKNLSLMTMISIASNPEKLTSTLFTRGWVIPCSEMRPDLQPYAVPVFINNGIIGYTFQPFPLTHVLKLFKWTGCLSATTSVGFSIRNRNIFIFMDEGRPCRPLIHLPHNKNKVSNVQGILDKSKSWHELVFGTYSFTQETNLMATDFFDPYQESHPEDQIPLEAYIQLLEPHEGVVEYVDPYEQNEAFVVNFPEHIVPEATHMEIHPCTIVSIVNGMIPFANYNQSPRNQLSCAQSKQAVSLYATNFQNRYDGTANILCYGEAPLIRTLQYDILGEGSMPYGHNVIMAIMPFHGFNRDDGIIFNKDAFERGLFRSLNYRSYSTFEEVDEQAKTQSVIANPLTVPQWTKLKVGADYSKLDERGIIRVGEFVDENTILVSKYIQDTQTKTYRDASLTPTVWTTGRVESVNVTVNNKQMMMVKIRVTQDRIPELGDKFSTRHGQKGTIGMLYKAQDLPRTKDGLVPDMLVNPHCIPSRMTVAQLLEIIFGKVCYENTMIGDATIFMSDKEAPEAIGRILETQFAMEKTSNEIMYDGESGKQMNTTIFMGPVFAMRLKHMVEDKWNARAEGRKEQRTRQPTGGRGNQGGLRIGDMEANTLVGHGVSSFLRESMMERSDKSTFAVCNGCGTIPIYNEKQGLYVCSMCDGPVTHFGSTPQNMELLPPVKRTNTTFTSVEIPYATKLLTDELSTFLNMGLRMITAKDLNKLQDETESIDGLNIQKGLEEQLKDRFMPDTRIPEYREEQQEVLPIEEDLVKLGLLGDDTKEAETIDPAEEQLKRQEEDERMLAMAQQLQQQQQPTTGTKVTIQLPQTQPSLTAPGNQEEQMEMAGQMAMPITTQIPMMTTTQMPTTETQLKIQLPTNSAQHVQTVPVVQGGGAVMIPQPVVYNNPIPLQVQSPTIVIDTGSQAMAASGYMEEEQLAARGVNTMGGRRHITPRARPMSPSRAKSPTVGGQQINASSKIMVKKLE